MWLTKALERWPGISVVMLAQDASVPDALLALRTGAADFLQRPYNEEEVRFVVEKSFTAVRLKAPRPPPPSSSDRGAILGSSPAMQQVNTTLVRAAQSTATVLIRGESGTGKELVARALHAGSPRSSKAFVKIDCTSLPENLLESELFGYEKGAFTGATSSKPGRAELAHGGTFFLDEVGELSLPLQAKLLRLLQDREFDRLGGVKPIQVNIRIVAATHRDLESMIERGQFRLDLFYRLNVVPLWLPPLRARRADIEALAKHFCAASCSFHGKPPLSFEARALHTLRAMRWPGNVRQLQNFIERLVVLSTGPLITHGNIQEELTGQSPFATQPHQSSVHKALDFAPTPFAGPRGTVAHQLSSMLADQPLLSLDEEVKAAERRALERALGHTRQNRSSAARLLGVSRSTLYAKLREHGLS